MEPHLVTIEYFRLNIQFAIFNFQFRLDRFTPGSSKDP